MHSGCTEKLNALLLPVLTSYTDYNGIAMWRMLSITNGTTEN